MDEMLIRDIRVGQVFDRAVFTPRGLMIVPPGVPIGPALLARLRNLRRGVILLGSPDEIPRRGHTVSATSLNSPTAHVGTTQAAASSATAKQTSVVNSGGAMDLQARAEEDTERGARRAMQRAWEFERSRLRQRASLRRSAEELVQAMAGRWERLPRRVSAPGMTGDVGGDTIDGDSRSPNVLEPSLLRRDDFGAPLALELATERADRVGILQRFWDRLLNAERVRSAVLVELVDELIDLMLRHSDRFAAIALGARRVNESVAEHAYATGALSVAIATRLGWEISDIRNAGLAGIMADSGMLLLATDVRDLARPLTEVEWNAMRRHPAYSLALVSHVLDLPEIIGLAVYQHHEREDGSGYPMAVRSGNGASGGGATGNERGVCDLARVVAAADVLAGASAARAYRSKLTPHGAVQLVVRQAASGQLDRQVVRAAVRAVGVFPTGSYVRLNTGEFGIVEAVRDPERADRPLVRLVEAAIATGSHGFLEPKPEVIDLAASEAQGISVIEALHLPGESELAMTA